MNNQTTGEEILKATIRQAAQWQVRNASGDMSAQEKQQFLEWLRASPLNIEQYLRNVQLTQLLPQVLAESSVETPQRLAEADEDNPTRGEVIPFGPLRPRPRSQRQQQASGFNRGRLLFLTTAGVALLAVALLLGWWADLRASSISVPHGEQRTVHLEDGSVVHLNSQSRMHVRFSAHERLIDLDSGQALFTVARERARPFRVRAGDADIVAVGTQFDVYRRKLNTTVTVLEGKIEVVERREAATAVNNAAAPGATAALALAAGQQVRMDGTAHPILANAVDLRRATAWTRREISFKAQPLADVAEEYGRYLDVPIRVEDESLARTQITGMFNAYSPEPFLAFLRSFPGVEVVEDRDAIHVRMRDPKRAQP